MSQQRPSERPIRIVVAESGNLADEYEDRALMALVRDGRSNTIEVATIRVWQKRSVHRCAITPACIWLAVALCAMLYLASVAVAAAQPNLIQLENAKVRTVDWQLTNPGHASAVIEGYASLTSVNRGGHILLFVSTAEPSYTIDLFRLGYYGGLGGRRVADTVQRPGVRQPVPTPDPVTGRIECQ